MHTYTSTLSISFSFLLFHLSLSDVKYIYLVSLTLFPFPPPEQSGVLLAVGFLFLGQCLTYPECSNICEVKRRMMDEPFFNAGKHLLDLIPATL
jgi:hypothetical protein